MKAHSYWRWPKTGPTAHTLTLLALFAFTACNKKDKEVPPQATLTLASFTPAEGSPGTTVVIKGTAFAQEKQANTVHFSGIPAEVRSVNASGTEVSVIVPEEATTGKITLKVADKTVTSNSDFKVNQLAPVINTVSPLKGDIGTEVTITGQRFKGECQIYFGTVLAKTVNHLDDKKLMVKVPEGALNGKLKVIANSFEVLSADAFWVKPRINQLMTVKGREEDLITLTGANFSDVKEENKIHFGTVQALEITEASATSLKVKVPAGGYGKISVSVADQKAETEESFVLLPTISSYISQGDRGIVATIVGKSFLPDAKVFLGTDEIKTFEPGRSATNIPFKVHPESNGGVITIVQLGETTQVGEFKVTNAWIPIYSGKGIINYQGNISFVYNNKIYLGFGYGKGNSNTIQNDAFSIFDPQTKKWSTGPIVPTNVPLREGASSRFINGKLYVGGGYNWQTGGSPLSDLWEFSPANNVWRKTNATVTNYSTGYGAYKNGNGAEDLYLFEGNKVSVYNSTNESLIDKNTAGSDINTLNASISTIGNNIYLFGGYINGTVSNKFLRYDVMTNTLTSMPQCPISNNAYYATFSINNKLYALVNPSFSSTEYKTLRFDPSNNLWTELKTDLISSDFFAGQKNSAVVDGKAYVWTYDGKVFEFIPN